MTQLLIRPTLFELADRLIMLEKEYLLSTSDFLVVYAANDSQHPDVPGPDARYWAVNAAMHAEALKLAREQRRYKQRAAVGRA